MNKNIWNLYKNSERRLVSEMFVNPITVMKNGCTQYEEGCHGRICKPAGKKEVGDQFEAAEFGETVYSDQSSEKK